MSDFAVRAAYVGCGQAGAERVHDGPQSRPTAGRMVPERGPDPDRIAVHAGESPATDLSQFDLVVATGRLSTDAVTRTVARVGESCAEDATCLAVCSGSEVSDPAVERVRAVFGTVVLADDAMAREFATDLFTWATLPTLLRTDRAAITENLASGGLATLQRATGQRADLSALAAQAGGRPTTDSVTAADETLFGYLEFGPEFTLTDDERFQNVCSDSAVVAGQATLDSADGCRLTRLVAATD